MQNASSCDNRYRSAPRRLEFHWHHWFRHRESGSQSTLHCIITKISNHGPLRNHLSRTLPPTILHLMHQAVYRKPGIGQPNVIAKPLTRGQIMFLDDIKNGTLGRTSPFDAITTTVLSSIVQGHCDGDTETCSLEGNVDDTSWNVLGPLVGWEADCQ